MCVCVENIFQNYNENGQLDSTKELKNLLKRNYYSEFVFIYVGNLEIESSFAGVGLNTDTTKAAKDFLRGNK